jgi:hypothetical protein
VGDCRGVDYRIPGTSTPKPVPARVQQAYAERILCELTLRKGAVIWDLNRMASQDWQSFPYKKGPFFKRTPTATAGHF